MSPVLVICRNFERHAGVVPIMAIITEQDKFAYPPPAVAREVLANVKRVRFFHSTCKECRKEG